MGAEQLAKRPTIWEAKYDELIEVLRVQENDSWHHCTPGDPRWIAYVRTLTAISAIEAFRAKMEA